jgi:hypothetical protein
MFMGTQREEMNKVPSLIASGEKIFADDLVNPDGAI